MSTHVHYNISFTQSGSERGWTSPCIRVYSGLPCSSLPPPRVWAALSADGEALYGEQQQTFWHVSFNWRWQVNQHLLAQKINASIIMFPFLFCFSPSLPLPPSFLLPFPSPFSLYPFIPSPPSLSHLSTPLSPSSFPQFLLLWHSPLHQHSRVHTRRTLLNNHNWWEEIQSHSERNHWWLQHGQDSVHCGWASHRPGRDRYRHFNSYSSMKALSSGCLWAINLWL